MKCPTCGYLGFESADRCRNCGYDFSLAPPADEAPELAIREGEDGAPFADLRLRSTPAAAPRPASGATARDAGLDRVMKNLDRVIGGPDADLPLFEEGADADAPPLVSAAAPPRRPLAVRRTTPDPARLRPKPVRPHLTAGPQPLELPLPDDPEPIGAGRTEDDPVVEVETPGAPPGRRVAAAVIDLAILGAIDVIVVYFTLRLCGLSTGEIVMLPLVPMGLFFLMVNGGYLTAFTAAGGQTIGKMALGLRVVGSSDEPVSTSSAALRAAGCAGSLVSFGLGYAPALLSEGGRALEDRLADTRVVRVPAS